MVPGVMFGSVIRLVAKSEIASRKLAKPSVLLRILGISFSVGIISWLATLFFTKSSFFYKFFMVTYFGLTNDTFFALLPFGMLWGVTIFQDKAMKRIWFGFTFIVFLFLLHTVLNPDGDLNKILRFDGNLLILIAILIFWIITTTFVHFYIRNTT